jgi:hypothetical protein
MFGNKSVVQNHWRCTEPAKLQLLYLDLGLAAVQQWLDSDIVGCLQSFFIKCQTGNYLQDPEVILLE